MNGLAGAGGDPVVLGVVLAGGRSRRFHGADKSFQVLAGRTLMERAIERFRPQVDDLVISASDDPCRLSECGFPVIRDQFPGHEGPFAGLEAGLSWLSDHRSDVRWVATLPVDVPFFPRDLVSRLSEAAVPADRPAVAASGGRIHPVIGLWPTRVHGGLRRYLGRRRRGPLVEFAQALGCRVVEFAASPFDPFFNVNTPADLDTARSWAGELEGEGSDPPPRI